MLVQFSVENYRSFKERATLSMVRATPDHTCPHNVTAQAQGTELDLLRSVAINGANASGKSNLLRALRFAARFVVGSAREGYAGSHRIDVSPFKLDACCVSEPSSFEFVLLIDSIRYVYGFSVDHERVHEEWLNYYPAGYRRKLFERLPSEDVRHACMSFGSDWKGERAKLEKLTRPNALFLSVAAQFNHEIGQTVLDWFVHRFRDVSWFPVGGLELAFTCTSALEHDGQKRDILDVLRPADIGITDFQVKRVPFAESKQYSQIPEEIRQNLFGESARDMFFDDVRMTHRGVDESGNENVVSFDMEDESDGTQKLFALAGPWRHVLQNGCVVVVDELDARLHPALTEWLVRWFHSDQLNPHGAQLIFATHDDNLMQGDLFRRDQIWFTEKDADGASTLYSLWDFKKRPGRTPRKEENIRRGYLSGRYGAVPFLEELPK